MGCLSDSKTVVGGGAGNNTMSASLQKLSAKLEELITKKRFSNSTCNC